MDFNNGLVAPIAQDLTKEDLNLQIIRGYTSGMDRVDEKFAPGTQLFTGEWGVLTADGLVRPDVTPSNMTYLVIAGSERSDVRATGKATVAKGKVLTVKTARYNKSASYAPGVELTVKNLGNGEAVVTPAAKGEWCVAKVLEDAGSYLVFETYANAVKMA